MEAIGEIINVLASFGHEERLRPLSFEWASREHEVREVTYRWQSREGGTRKYHFSVTDGGTLYELSFDPASLLWRLEHLEA